MKNTRFKSISRFVSSASKPGIRAFAILALAFCGLQANAADNRAPQLPSPLCDSLQAPEGNKVAFHVYAIGVQIYRWNGTSWAFVAPAAVLYANPGYDGEVGTHYAGPTWESNSGSKVRGTRIHDCTPDANSIPWLLLQAAATNGPGIFHRVTYIQRVNTVGGVAPGSPGTVVGEERQVPYTAEYYFYRAQAE
jgi:hypothetical protein